LNQSVCRLDRIVLNDELYPELCRKTSTKMSKHPPLDTRSGTCYPSHAGVWLAAG
jgi:hypothetical protein